MVYCRLQSRLEFSFPMFECKCVKQPLTSSFFSLKPQLPLYARTLYTSTKRGSLIWCFYLLFREQMRAVGLKNKVVFLARPACDLLISVLVTSLSSVYHATSAIRVSWMCMCAQAGVAVLVICLVSVFVDKSVRFKNFLKHKTPILQT